MTFPERREFRLLVTGSRDWESYGAIDAAIGGVLDRLVEARRDLVVVHGACPTGADAMAATYCEENAWWVDNLGRMLAVEAHPADWSQGKKAGPLRNQAMVDLGADLCLAFPLEGSRGTWDCVKRARAAGIEVRVIKP